MFIFTIVKTYDQRARNFTKLVDENKDKNMLSQIKNMQSYEFYNPVSFESKFNGRLKRPGETSSNATNKSNSIIQSNTILNLKAYKQR